MTGDLEHSDASQEAPGHILRRLRRGFASKQPGMRACVAYSPL